jgi:uncharacterized flavoprotein (TIGR03862 family)
MKASPLLRAWLRRLDAQGVTMRTRVRWTGWDDSGALRFVREDWSTETLTPSATILALGGASWPRLGSDGAWKHLLAARGVEIAPLKPANVGFDVYWSDPFRSRFAGQPLKSIAVTHRGRSVRGECVITQYGLEGGVIYALSAELRDAFASKTPVRIDIDLRPTLSHAEIVDKLQHLRRGDSLSNTLRKTLGLAPVAINLLREPGAIGGDFDEIAARIKAVPLVLQAPRGLERAISTAGGVRWNSVTPALELKALPGVYAVGEMLDWEAPTGGYLLQACYATGVHAARAILDAAT